MKILKILTAFFFVFFIDLQNLETMKQDNSLTKSQGDEISPTFKEFKICNHWVNEFELAPNEKFLVAACEKSEIIIFDLESQKYLKSFKGNGPILITPCSTKIITLYNDTILQIYDLETKNNPKFAINHTDTISALAIITYLNPSKLLLIESYDPLSVSPMKIIATGSRDKTIQIWDIDKKNCLKILKGHEKMVSVLIALSDKKQLLSGSQDTTVKLWNSETGECLKTFSGHDDTITCITLIPNSTQFISGSSDQTIRMWNIDSGKCLRRIENPCGTIISLILTSDKKYLISGSLEKIKIYDFQSGVCIKKFEGSPNSMYALVFWPSKNKIISTSFNSIRIWEMSSINKLMK